MKNPLLISPHTSSSKSYFLHCLCEVVFSYLEEHFALLYHAKHNWEQYLSASLLLQKKIAKESSSNQLFLQQDW